MLRCTTPEIPISDCSCVLWLLISKFNVYDNSEVLSQHEDHISAVSTNHGPLAEMNNGHFLADICLWVNVWGGKGRAGVRKSQKRHLRRH